MARTPSKPLFDLKWLVNMQHIISNGIREYSQWFHGANNNVAAALSRDKDRTDNELTQISRSHRPSQLPQYFEIVPLPNEILSWLTLLLLRLPVKQQLVDTHSTMKLGRGIVTPSTAPSKTCPKLTESKLLEVLQWLCVKGNFLDHVMYALLAESTVSDTLNHAAGVLRETRHNDPKWDAERNVA